MVILALRQSQRRWSALDRRSRRSTRFALDCEFLEGRQLLSVGQTSFAVTAPAVPPPVGAAAEVYTPQTVSAASGTTYPSLASQYGTAAGASTSQVGYLLTQLASASAPSIASGTGLATTKATVSDNPAANTTTGSNVTVTNLSVSPLNPLMTSPMAAITDTQVNADAYLVPSTEDLLEDHLGESTMPAVVHEPQPATNNPLLSGIFQPRFPVIFLGRNAVSNMSPTNGLSLIDQPGANQNTPTMDYVEPFEPTSPVQSPESQPATPQGEPQSPPSSSAAPTNPQGGPAAPADSAPAANPQGGQGSSAGGAPAPGPAGGPGSGAAASAHLDGPAHDGAEHLQSVIRLVDSRVAPDSPAADPDSQSDGEQSITDPCMSLSVVFGVAAMATSGYRVAMRDAHRVSRRVVPRWSGSELPTRRKRPITGRS